MQTPDGWLFGLTCCSYITSEAQVPPQAHDTGKLQTAKYTRRRRSGNISQVRGKIINTLFKPCVRNPGSGLRRPIISQHLSLRGNTWTTSEWFGQLKGEGFLVVQMLSCSRTARNDKAHNPSIKSWTSKGRFWGCSTDFSGERLGLCSYLGLGIFFCQI